MHLDVPCRCLWHQTVVVNAVFADCMYRLIILCRLILAVRSVAARSVSKHSTRKPDCDAMSHQQKLTAVMLLQEVKCLYDVSTNEYR